MRPLCIEACGASCFGAPRFVTSADKRTSSTMGKWGMATLLRESHVEQLLTMPRTMELVERVHREYSTGQAIDVPRERTRLPKAALHILQGAVPSAGVFGYKAYTSSREGIRFLVYAFNAERG